MNIEMLCLYPRIKNEREKRSHWSEERGDRIAAIGRAAIGRAAIEGRRRLPSRRKTAIAID